MIAVRSNHSVDDLEETARRSAVRKDGFEVLQLLTQLSQERRGERSINRIDAYEVFSSSWTSGNLPYKGFTP
jgi:hypothetical protein